MSTGQKIYPQLKQGITNQIPGITKGSLNEAALFLSLIDRKLGCPRSLAFGDLGMNSLPWNSLVPN
jgi:hypothetical protein